MKNLLRLSFLFLACLGVLHAQPAVPAVPKQAPGTQMRGLLFRMVSNLGEIYAYDPADVSGSPGVKIEFKNYLNENVTTLQLKGDGVVLTNSASRESISKPDSVIANVKLGKATHSAIILLVPGTGKPGDPKCRALVYDDRLAAFPAGTYQITNLSSRVVKYVLGDKPYEFKPGEIKQIAFPKGEPGASIPMTAYSAKGTDWERIASSMWSDPGAGIRQIQVLFENPRTGRIEMDAYQDTSF